MSRHDDFIISVVKNYLLRIINVKDIRYQILFILLTLFTELLQQLLQVKVAYVY